MILSEIELKQLILKNVQSWIDEECELNGTECVTYEQRVEEQVAPFVDDVQEYLNENLRKGG